MGARKIKIVKKDAPQKGEFDDLSGKMREWLNAHYRLIGGVVIGAFLVFLVVWGVNAYGDAKERRARGEYAEALRSWPGDDGADPKAWEMVAPELEKFINQYAGTRAALNARLDLSRAYYQMGKYDESIKWGTSVIEKVSPGDELGSLAMYQLAIIYQTSGDKDKALAQWSALAAASGPEKLREIDWNMARLYAGKGDQAKAVTLYEQALKSTGSYPGTVVLQEELAALRAKSKVGS